ncbi:MAG: c-type cytochrome [Burkholderiaceae bacterium]
MRISHLRAARTAAVSVFISACLTVPAFAQAPAAEVKGDPARGAMKNSMCIGCHGIPEYKTAFPVLYRVPKIAHQNEAYLVSALKAYKAGERNHPSMVAVSTSLTEQDMADLAAFYARGGK